MIKLIITGRRRPGMTRAALSRHLREVHGPMVVMPPPDAGTMPSGYVQNHVHDGIYPPGGSQPGIERDFITEVWFNSLAEAGESTATPYYKTVLQPDEPKFVALDTVQRCLALETIVKAGAVGSRKAFLFWSGGAGFAEAWPQVREAASGDAGVRQWIANETRALPGPAPLPYDGIDEVWLTEDADAGALQQIMLEELRNHLDPAGCFFVIAEAFTTERLRAQ